MIKEIRQTIKSWYGATVAKNLQRQSGNIPLYSDNVNIKLKQVFHEFDFLISQGLGFDRSFETIGEGLKSHLSRNTTSIRQARHKDFRVRGNNKNVTL